MSLFDKVNEDLKTAIKAQDKDRMEALRAIKTAFLLARSDKGAASILSEDEELKIIQRLVKQRKESADIFKAQNRDDLYQNEVKEAEVISAYLPGQLSEAELTQKLKEIIARTGADSAKDFGKVMGAATKELAGKADGKAIAAIVKELLG